MCKEKKAALRKNIFFLPLCITVIQYACANFELLSMFFFIHIFICILQGKMLAYEREILIYCYLWIFPFFFFLWDISLLSLFPFHFAEALHKAKLNNIDSVFCETALWLRFIVAWNIAIYWIVMRKGRKKQKNTRKRKKKIFNLHSQVSIHKQLREKLSFLKFHQSSSFLLVSFFPSFLFFSIFFSFIFFQYLTHATYQSGGIIRKKNDVK